MITRHHFLLFVTLFSTMACAPKSSSFSDSDWQRGTLPPPRPVVVPAQSNDEYGDKVELPVDEDKALDSLKNEQQKNAKMLANLSPTTYYVPLINMDKPNCRTNEMKDIDDLNGKKIASLCENDWKNCLLQGTCLLHDKRESIAINYNAQVKNEPRFAIIDVSKCPFGLGSTAGVCLDPFHSIAADLDYHKLGDVLFVPKLKGLRMQNGEIHDGYVVVRDSGGNIKGENRFDFFNGFFIPLAKDSVMLKEGFTDSASKFAYRKATDLESRIVRQLRGYPGLSSKVLKPQ